VPIVEHADVRRMLLAQKAYAEGGLALCLYCARLVDDEQTGDDAQRERAAWLLELLTPIVKSWPSQWCLEANSLAIQVHGGYGYTRDYDVEQFYRDNRLNPIHEGTHGIQALDLLGRKMVIGQGRAAMLFAGEIEDCAARAAALAAQGDAGAELAATGRQLAAAASRVFATVRRLHAVGDLDVTLANATVFLEAFGHLVVAWQWLEQAMVAHAAVPATDADRDFYAGKLQAARYFFRWELPRIGPMLDLLDSIDTTTLDMKDAWF
jgi:acyl-CoA dehydrogenase